MMGVSLPPFPQAPGFPGHEGIGEVVESRDPRFRPGDRVLTVPIPPRSYTFAEYQTLPGAFCLTVPRSGDLLHLLMAQQLGTVIFALRQRPVDVVGKTVMVIGQGSAGMFFAFLLKRAGAARVIVSDLSEARLALSHRLGADVALRAEGSHVRKTVMELTSDRGVDYLVEAVGRAETLLESVNLAGMRADILLFGLPDSREPVPFNFHGFFRKQLRAASTYGAQSEPGLVSFQAAVDLIARHEIDVSPLVSHVLPIDAIDRAMHLADARADNAIKVSIRFDAPSE
jgi:L-iditol 2-dehydrogenase